MKIMIQTMASYPYTSTQDGTVRPACLNQQGSICFPHVASPAPTWFPLEQVLRLDGCDLRHGGEDVGAVGGSTLQAVPVVDLPVACFLIHVELSEAQREEAV